MKKTRTNHTDEPQVTKDRDEKERRDTRKMLGTGAETYCINSSLHEYILFYSVQYAKRVVRTKYFTRLANIVTTSGRELTLD
jgi:hypothetical protein